MTLRPPGSTLFPYTTLFRSIARRIVLQLDAHHRRSPVGRALEADRTRVADGSAHRLPGDDFAGPVVDDIGLPLDGGHACRRLQRPARPPIAQTLDPLEMRHEPRKVRQLAPDAMERVGCLVDRELTLDPDAEVTDLLTRDRAGAVDAERAVEATVSAEPAIHERAAERGEHDPAQTDAPEAVEAEHCPGQQREHPLTVADVDAARRMSTSAARRSRPIASHRAADGHGSPSSTRQLVAARMPRTARCSLIRGGGRRGLRDNR